MKNAGPLKGARVIYGLQQDCTNKQSPIGSTPSTTFSKLGKDYRNLKVGIETTKITMLVTQWRNGC